MQSIPSVSANFNPELDRIDEEFNNFMHKVNEVNGIVKKLTSKDKGTQEMGVVEADNFLKDRKDFQDIEDEDAVNLKVNTNRTLINKKALRNEQTDENAMSQDAFMDQVSKDADKRYKDRMIRKEKADTLKTQATKAFRRGEFEKALTLYNKAIDQIKDSCMFYINRSLCQMHLDRLENAIEDAEKALYFNENSLKARLLLAKYHFLNDNVKEFDKEIKEAKERHKDQISAIEDFVQEQFKTKQSQS